MHKLLMNLLAKSLLAKSKTLGKNQKGMTLVEIMIVLAILASIAAVIINNVSGRLAESNIRQARIQIGQISGALDFYRLSCYRYPTTDEGLEALVEPPDSCANWGPEPYLRQLPRDPWGRPFIYESDGSTYEIITYGRNGRPGGTGEDAEISSADL